MNIVFITPWYPDDKQPFHGLFIREQAIALAARHKVYVIVSKVDYSCFSLSKYSLIKQEDNSNLMLYQLTINKSLPIFNQLHHLFVTWSVSKKILRHKKIDLIHSFIGYPGAILGWMLSKTMMVPYVHTEHTKLNNNYRSWLHRLLTNFGMRKANAITTVSNWLATQLQEIVNKPVHVIPNLINITRFTIAKRSTPNILHFGFLGGLNTNVKGLDILLMALGKYHGDFVLHIGGEGRLKEGYKQLATELGIADKCIFHGSIPIKNIPEFYHQLSFFICASRHETFSIAIIEALASGIPVLSTKCGGPEEIIRNDGLGLLVESGSPEELLNGIQLMNLKLGSFHGEKIRDFIKSKYSIEVIMPMYEQVYSDCVR